MVTITNKKQRISRITSMVNKLSAQEQNELLKRLEQKIMEEKAQKLAGGVIKNNLTMSGIVNEVRKARNQK